MTATNTRPTPSPLSSWVTVELPTGGTVTVYGTPETWPEWVKETALEKELTVGE